MPEVSLRPLIDQELQQQDSGDQLLKVIGQFGIDRVYEPIYRDIERSGIRLSRARFQYRGMSRPVPEFVDDIDVERTREIIRESIESIKRFEALLQ